MANRLGIHAPSNTPRPRRFSREEPSDPNTSAFSFSSPTDSWIPYDEVLRTFHLRDNVQGMFAGEQLDEPPPPYNTDQASFRTYRNLKHDWNDDGDPWDTTSGPQTPRANEFRTAEHSMPRKKSDSDDGWQIGGPESWPVERPNSRPPSPQPFPPALPDETDFLKAFPDGKASIKYSKDDGTKEEICGLDKSEMIQRCELLEHVFECEARRTLHLYLEVLTERSALPFIRYLHTGAYARNPKAAQNVYDEPPTPLLVHVELFRLAKHFELPTLAIQVRGNLHIQTEFCCSHPEKPIGLVSSIRFIFEHRNAFQEDYEDILDIIVNYCVACFRDNRLAEDAGFKQLIQEDNGLYQRMFQNSLARDEAAKGPGRDYLGVPWSGETNSAESVTTDIVQLSFEPSGTKTPKPKPIDAIKTSTSPQSPSSQLEGLKSLVLSPHRKRRAQKQISKQEETESTDSEAITASEDEDGYSLLRKRSKTERPFSSNYDTDNVSAAADNASGISDSDRPSDSEYDVISGPSRILSRSSIEPSDTESDWEQLPRVLPTRELPIRSMGSAPERADHDDADQSESDWERLSQT